MTTTASTAGEQIAETADPSKKRAYPRSVSRAGTRGDHVTIGKVKPSPSTGGLHQCCHQGCIRPAVSAGECRHHNGVQSHWRTGGFVDAGPVRRHMRALLDAGLSVRAIHCVTSVDHRALAQLVIGAPVGGTWPQGRIPAADAQSILAIPVPRNAVTAGPEGEAMSALEVPAIGTVRRLRALIAIGHDPADIGQQIDLTDVELAELLCGAPVMVDAAVARRAADLFAELQMTPGPCAVCRDEAVQHGWSAPLAWDEHSIDNPGAAPQRPRRQVLWDERYLELRAMGYDKTDIAERLGITMDSLYRQLQRYGMSGSELTS